MALDTYANLQTAVLAWLARPADSLISGSVPDMITLFEAEADTELQATHWQEASYTFQTVAPANLTTNSTTASGNATLHFASVPSTIIAGMTVIDVTAPNVIPGNTTVLSTTMTTVVLSANVLGAGVGSGDNISFTQPTYPLPADFSELRWIKITSLNPIVELTYSSPGNLDVNWTLWDTDIMANYTLEGSNIRFGPVPDQVYTLVMDYYQEIPPLSNTNTSNWLLANYPNLYLFGTLCEAEAFLGGDDEDERFAMWMQRRDSTFVKVKAADRRFKVGGAPLTMHMDFVNP